METFRAPRTERRHRVRVSRGCSLRLTLPWSLALLPLAPAPLEAQREPELCAIAEARLQARAGGEEYFRAVRAMMTLYDRKLAVDFREPPPGHPGRIYVMHGGWTDRGDLEGAEPLAPSTRGDILETLRELERSADDAALRQVAASLLNLSLRDGLPVLRLRNDPPSIIDGQPAWDLTWVDDSTVAIADVAEQRVVLLTPASGRARILGRRGRGPGEFVGIGSVTAGTDGRMAVYDLALRRLTMLSPSGAVTSTVTLPGVPLRILAVHGGQTRLMWTEFGPGGSATWIGAVAGQDPVRWFQADSVLAGAGLIASNRPPTPAITAIETPGGSLLLAAVQRYSILQVDRSGRVERVFQRPLPAEKLSRAEQARHFRTLERAFRAGGVPAARIRDLRAGLDTMTRAFFPASGFSVDHAGRLWVVTGRVIRDSTEVDVFSPAGAFLGTLRLRDQVRSLTWRGPKAAALVEERLTPHTMDRGVLDVYQLLPDRAGR